MVVFLTPTSTADNKPGVVSFDVQYFIPTQEVPLCGHGTIAAIKIVLDSAKNLPEFGQGSQFPAFASPEIHTVEFTTVKGLVVSARHGRRGLVRNRPSSRKLRSLSGEEMGRVIGR